MGCRGPQLDFFVAAEAKNLIDLNRIILCVEVAIEDCERTTIDETNQTINLDQQDTGVSVVEFLSALQVNTKQLPKKFLTLVEVLRIPQFLLANTYARQTSNQNHHQVRLASGASPYKRLKLGTEQGSSSQWLTNF